jgi:hypothetical protein
MKFTTVALSFLCTSGLAGAATNLVSVGVNFQDDVVGVPLAAASVAGAVPQANWNNGTGANNTLSNLTADFNGSPAPTAISVTWSGSPNTWASTGRGEENNAFPPGPDRDLMTGYVDTTDVSITTFTFSGIPEPYATLGYDVLVYTLGGVPGRGGDYTIGGITYSGDSPTNPTDHSLDPGVDHSDTGTYMRFDNVTGAGFTLTAVPTFGAPFRAPVNAIQIIERIPEPSAFSLAGLLAGFLLWRRRGR